MIKCTRTIYEESARSKTLPGIGYNFALQSPALLHILLTPLADGGRILAEHAFARTGHVTQNEVERELGLAEITRIVVGHHAVGIAPLGDVLQQDLCTITDGLIAHQRAVVGQYAEQSGRFSTRSSTEIQSSLGSGGIDTPDDMGDEHRCGLLYVITAGMEEWIEGELRAPGEIIAFFTPGDSFLWNVECGMWNVASRVQAYADGGLLIEGSHETVKALVAHYQPRFTFEILR